jgi:hypothetical protein
VSLIRRRSGGAKPRDRRRRKPEERYAAYLGVRVNVELGAAIDAVCEATSMRRSDCLRHLLGAGLSAWQNNPEARMVEEAEALGVDITVGLQAELVKESRNLRITQSDFARRLLVEGLKVWRDERNAKARPR